MRHSEKKIDRLEHRLQSIEALLRNLPSQLAATSGSNNRLDPARADPSPQTGSNSVLTAASTVDYDSSDNESGYGGDNALSEQTAFASEFLESAVRKTTLTEANPKMQAALANLSQLVQMQKVRSISHGPKFPLCQPVPPGGLYKLQMPPLDTITALLKQSQGAQLTVFSLMCVLLGVTDFEDRCRSVYFPTEESSDATFIIVNAGLYNLLQEEQEIATDPALREQYQSSLRICSANLETSLANLPLFLNVKMEIVQALLFGAFYSIDMSRPSVAWHLASSAAQLCLTGGYHRDDCVSQDPPVVTQTKTVLFWHTYTLDRSLSLRLGRASMIDDCDITIPHRFNYDGIGQMAAAAPLLTMWIQIAEIQGRIYSRLYSPAAHAGSQADLVQWARKLALQCQTLEAELETLRGGAMAALKARGASTMMDLLVLGDEVQYDVTMTLIYQAIPAPAGSLSRFCNECLQYARKAILAHERCMGRPNLGEIGRSMYIHWNLMLTPFAPFFVLFCFVIETSSIEDLRAIQRFTKSLLAPRQSSETIDKLYCLCQVMCDAATLYVEARSAQEKDQSMISIGDEFEMYLGQLGFMPGEDQVMSNAAPGEMSLQGQGQIANMADWFSGSKNMLGLLEEDLSQIDYPWVPPGPQ